MALFFDPKQECFRGANENVRNQQFNMYLKKINKVTYTDKTDIEKVKLIAGHAKKLSGLYRFHELEKCDEDELTYLLNVYSEILSILKDYKSDLPEFRTHYKEVEDVYKNIREARKDITVKSITKALERSRPQSTFHIPSDMPPVIRRPISDFAVPTKSTNPFAKGNENKHKEFVKEQKAKKRSSAASPDGPPPPPPPHIVTPPKSSSARSRSRSAKSSEGQRAIVTPPKEQRSRSRSSPNKLLDSRSLGHSLGMTARRVPSLSQRRRRGGKTRKHKKN